MSPSKFLREYWQKKPLLVRGAFPDWQDSISPEELAGLACEDGVESRIVREKGGAHPWEVTWGPQDERVFSKMPERGWTLLVQEVNRWVPDAARLLDRFDFLPNVRVDDVMISFAEPGGSVGAHVDSYDVFLVQGLGQRRWKYHERPTKDVAMREGLELRILKRFVPEADEVLGPGDMLYLPPGFAHHGVAVTSCLTYSVGFRAPSAREAWLSFAASQTNASLLADPALAPATNPGAIPPAMLSNVRKLIRSIDSSDAAIDRWFASFATRLKPGHELNAPERALSEAKVMKAETFVRTEEGRWAYLDRTKPFLLFVGGQEIQVPAPAQPLARILCTKRVFEAEELAPHLKTKAARALLTDLVNRGALSV